MSKAKKPKPKPKPKPGHPSEPTATPIETTAHAQLRAAHHSREETELGGWPVGVTTYRVGETWICKIDNVSPGAVVARARGATREAAVSGATERARPRMNATRRVSID